MSLDADIIAKSRSYVSQCMQRDGSAAYTYHNVAHTNRVEEAARILADEAQLPTEEKDLLILAAIFHDVGFCYDAEKHELVSAEMAERKLRELGVSDSQVAKVKQLIMATKLNWNGQDRLAMLLRDADLSGLADPDFFVISEGLRKERAALNGEHISEEEWHRGNLLFFQNHKYLSPEGKSLFNKNKKKNRKKLQKMISDMEDRSLTIATSKSAQTQIKTALRNHIDLSAIADNKANMMLSINAIVLTVGMPLLIDTMRKNPKLLLPTIIIGIASVISIIFATLSTRPQKMSGVTDRSLIKQKKSNLFFFGNFYNMKFEDYEAGIKEVVADNEIMDNSITRDLFYLGKTLGNKFAYLRICYGVFAVGIVVAALSFAVVLIWGN